MGNEEVYVGIDVSKAHLDVSVSSEARVWRTTNDPEGIASLLTSLGRVAAQTREHGVQRWVRVPGRQQS